MLAAFDVGVPVRQLEVVIATGQARAVVDARPGGFGNAVGALPHPLLVVLDVAELDLADRRHRRSQRGRRYGVPTMAVPPRTLRGATAFPAARLGIAGQCSDRRAIEHAVVDADLVEVTATQEVVAALHLVRRHHPPGQTQLVERGVIVAGGFGTRDFPAIDKQRHALVFIPAEGDVLPLLRRRIPVQLERDTGAREVGVGDEGIEAVSVPVDAQPRHVPAAVVCIADAEDDEGRFAHRITRTPEERQRTARGLDVARCIPRQHAVVLPLDGAAMHTVINKVHLVLEVGHRIALRMIGDEAMVGRDTEQQLRRFGRRHHRHQQQAQHTGQTGGTQREILGHRITRCSALFTHILEI
ncbi:hypothetical protein D3C81_691080 [compost metagenome]